MFGSVARGQDTEDSDLDLLIDPTPKTTMLDIGAMRHELRALRTPFQYGPRRTRAD
ncbi:nucleotidyltransferase family protein [Caballeronia ptereochthonis]|uniref:nucleotidyltransferase family protein n=1 Tax=Caballeronia ptereochthonis TaxID=1777144 RepID=UPI0035B52308